MKAIGVEMAEERGREICMGCILMEVLAKLLGPYANKEEDASGLNLLTYDIMMINNCEPVSKIQSNLLLCYKIFGLSAPPITMRYEIG